jgi:hypothetical protein
LRRLLVDGGLADRLTRRVQRWKVIMTVQGRKKVQREPRRQMNGRSAWITTDDGVTRHECAVIDVAPGGAKIEMDVEIDVGGRFELALVPSHPKRQQCEVVWRRDTSFGVKFLPAGAEQPSREAIAEEPTEQGLQKAPFFRMV